MRSDRQKSYAFASCSKKGRVEMKKDELTEKNSPGKIGGTSKQKSGFTGGGGKKNA